jgi:hypothetical protein
MTGAFCFLFQIANYINNRCKHISCQHGRGCAEVICGIKTGLRMDPRAGDGSLECVPALGAETGDQTGEDVACSGVSEGGRGNRDQRDASIG